MEPPVAPGGSWTLVVYGDPVPQGSKSAVPVMRRDENGRRVPVFGRGGFPVINVTDQNEKKLKPWRQDLAEMAVLKWGPRDACALDEACIVRLTFFVERPQGHWRADGSLKDSAPLYPESTGGDLDKLVRAVLDALTGIVVKNDKRVVTLPSKRRFGSPARVEITVRRPHVRTVGDLRRLHESAPDLADALADELQLSLALS
jgi:Holliday junction resolvase RusA-like endonuclease